MIPMQTAMTEALRSLRVVSVAVLFTEAKPTGPVVPPSTRHVGASGWIVAMRRGVRRDAPGAIWAVVLAVVVLGPGLAPGYLLVRDMVWVPDLALRPDFLGLGSGLPRAVPSDALVAVLDQVVPGMLLQKVLLLAALAVGGVGVTRLLDREGEPATLVVRLVAVTVYGWNAYLAERLLMGQWPVLVGYAVLPWVLVTARRWRTTDRLPSALLVLVPLGCLSASAGLVTALAVLAAAAGR